MRFSVLILLLLTFSTMKSFHLVNDAMSLRRAHVLENLEYSINQWRYRLSIINHKLHHTPTDTSLIYAQSEALNT